MSTLRNPVGPQPPAVYWRRRLLVVLGIVAVVVIVFLIVARPGAGSGEPNANPSGSANPSNSASPDPTDAAGDPNEPCDPSVIVLEPITDSDAYPPDQQPMLSMSISNTGAAPCTIEAGTGAQEYLIMSGSDRIWDSKDCQTAPTTLPVVLEPGKPQQTQPFPWDRTRSSAETCSGDRQPVVAGGATYRLSVKLGEIESEGDRPFILQ